MTDFDSIINSAAEKYKLLISQRRNERSKPSDIDYTKRKARYSICGGTAVADHIKAARTFLSFFSRKKSKGKIELHISKVLQ